MFLGLPAWSASVRMRSRGYCRCSLFHRHAFERKHPAVCFLCSTGFGEKLCYSTNYSRLFAPRLEDPSAQLSLLLKVFVDPRGVGFGVGIAGSWIPLQWGNESCADQVRSCTTHPLKVSPLLKMIPSTQDTGPDTAEFHLECVISRSRGFWFGKTQVIDAPATFVSRWVVGSDRPPTVLRLPWGRCSFI